MANTATLAIQIVSDATRAAKGFRQAEAQTSKFENGLKRANRVATVTAGALLAVGAASLKQASQLQQSNGAIRAVFGQQSAQVAKLAKSAADAVGLSQASYQQLAATFGSQLKNMGVASAQLVPKTDQLIKLGADLAATYGGSTSDAVAALGSLLRGERDPIEKYGVSIKQADINAVLAAKGQDKLTGAAKKTAETQATLALLTQQTAGAQGQFAKESTSAEGAAARAQAKIDNMGASLGVVLLPAATAAATALATLATWTTEHSTAAQIAAGVIGGLAVAVFAVTAATKLWTAATVTARAVTVLYRNAQIALNIALLANPIGLVVAGVLLLIAGLVLAYKKSATFRAIVQAVGKAGAAAFKWITDRVKELWGWLSSKVPAAANAVKTAAVNAFNAITSPIRALIGWVGRLISKIRGIDWPSPPAWVTRVLNGGLGSLIGSYHDFGATGGASYALAPAVFSAPGTLNAASPEWTMGRVGGRGGGSIVQIVVNGALDPDAVAKQIESILAGRGRRLGRFTR